ncbi:DUF2279 domain-containing protein [Thermodesulfobacteriota bacterium]
MKSISLVLSALLMFFSSLPAAWAEASPVPPIEICAEWDLADFPSLSLALLQAQEAESGEAAGREPNMRLRRWIAHGIAFGGAAGFAGWAAEAWWSEGKKSFGIDEEAFFGQDTYTGGADKLGHMWGGYWSTRAVTSLYRWAGVPKKKALLIGSLYSVGLLTMVEFADGFTDFRFSFEDVAVNTIGTLLAGALILYPKLDDLIDFRLEYFPSETFIDKGDHVNFAEDYSGMTFLFVLRLAGIPRLKETPLRFFDLDVGYYTLYYKPEDESKIPERHFVAGVSLDMREFLDVFLLDRFDGYRKTKLIVRTTLEYLQIPYTRVSVVDHMLPQD